MEWLNHWNNNDIPKWISYIIGILLSIGGIFRTIFVVHESIRNHEKRIKELEGSCDIVKETMGTSMTDTEHKELCEKNNHFMCRKVEEVKQSVTIGHEKLAQRMDKMDRLREEARKEEKEQNAIKAAKDIEIFRVLGRVEKHLKKG